MSRKRRNTSSPELQSPSAKRRSISSEYDSDESDYPDYPEVNQRPQIDVTTGQSGAFPGVGNDDELFYGPAADGIDYLRMVRSERKDIPELLTTIQPPIQGETNGGYWHDGAYTAQPTARAEQEEVFSKAQLLYYDSLSTRFRLIRATMNCIPPLSEIEALEPTRPISFPSGQRAARDTWERQILQELPHPVQVACMDASSLFEVIKHMTRRMGNFFRASHDIDVQRIGAWIWALLGKCPERGELGSEEISELRAFAQRAVEVVDHMNDKGAVDRAAMEDEDDPEDEYGQVTAISETRSANVSALKLANDEQQDVPSILNDGEGLTGDIAAHRRMLVDMILTVVGEVYGQRDLLDLRKPWPAEAID